METNFFKQIAQIEFTGTLQMSMAKGSDNNIIVSVILINDKCGDEAKQHITPLILRGSSEELDEGFFEHIMTPIKTVSGLMVNMEVYLKQIEIAKANSAMEKAKTDKQKKEQEAKEKRYKDAMNQADELEKTGKYREAWMKVPETTTYPEKAQEINKRKSELSAKFQSPSLFGALPEQETPKNKVPSLVFKNEFEDDEFEDERTEHDLLND